MDLPASVRMLVDERCPGWGEERRAERVASILKNGLCYFDAEGILCVKASERNVLSSMLQNGHELPTRVSPPALALLERLRELQDKGVITPVTVHDLGTVDKEAR